MDKGIDDATGSPFTGHDIQDWAKELDIEWRFYLPHDPQASGLEEWNIKEQIKLLTSKDILAT